MRTSILPSLLLVLLAAGCSAAGSGTPATAPEAGTMKMLMQPKTVSQQPWLYVAGSSNNIIDAYDLDRNNNPLSATITTGIDAPNGIAIGPKGRLFVTNGNNTISEYPFGSTVPLVTLNVTDPVSDSVNPLNDDLYVAVRSNPPGIAVFHPKETEPSRFIVSPLLSQPGQIFFDSTGTLYIADNNMGISTIKPYSYRVVSLKLKDLLPCPSGVVLDNTTSSLFVSSCDGGGQVYTLGNNIPIRELDLPFPAMNLAIGTVKNAVDVYAPDSQSNTVAVFNTSSSSPIKTLTTGSTHPLGVAVKPANVPPPN